MEAEGKYFSFKHNIVALAFLMTANLYFLIDPGVWKYDGLAKLKSIIYFGSLFCGSFILVMTIILYIANRQEWTEMKNIKKIIRLTGRMGSPVREIQCNREARGRVRYSAKLESGEQKEFCFLNDKLQKSL